MMADRASGLTHVLVVVDEEAFERLGGILQLLCVGMVDEPVRLNVLSHSALPMFSGAPVEALGPARVVRLPRKAWHWWRRPDAKGVLDQIEINRPDVVHCLSAGLAGDVHGWCADWQSVLLVHVTDLEDVRQFGSSDWSDIPAVVPIATTQSLAAALLQQQPEAKEVVRVIPMGHPARDEPACRSRPERIPAVLVAAPLTRESRLENVFQSLQAIIRSGREVQLFLLASGPAEGYYRRLVEQLNLRSHVTFAGPLRTWQAREEALRSADIFILPSTAGRFNIMTLGAMASGLAVLAPHGTLEDYLIDEQTALLFDSGSTRDLTRRWSMLLEDAAAARRLADAALHQIRTYHQASSMVSATASLYRGVCELALQGTGR